MVRYRIPVCSPLLGDREVEMVTSCIRSSWISSQGPIVAKFESRFSRFVEAKCGVTTNSGTTALHLAMAALGIGRGDEVIMPTFTMIASINAVEYQGAKAVLVDADPESWCMDVSRVGSRVTSKTKAIMPVHIYGHPTDMDPILQISKRHGIHVVEDAAEAHGAEYKGRKVGALGKVGSFSFYSNKIVTTGEGGMNVTNDAGLAERMRWLRSHAFGRGARHFWHEELGFGYRMSALQAAVGLAQMGRIREMIRRRISHAHLYNDLLRRLSGTRVTLPPEKRWAKNVYWMYSVLVNNPSKRDDLMHWLGRRGIETRTFFHPIHKQPYYASRFSEERFPVADGLAARGMNLPSGNSLEEKDVHYVCDSILAYFRQN